MESGAVILVSSREWEMLGGKGEPRAMVLVAEGRTPSDCRRWCLFVVQLGGGICSLAVILASARLGVGLTLDRR